MGSRRNFGTGRTHAAENDLTIVPTSWNGGGPLVVVCHGVGGSASTYFSSAARRDLDYLANTGPLGCCVVVADLRGLNTWGIDAAVDTSTGGIAEVRSYGAATWGADTSKMVIIGDSMGGMNGLGYTWRAPSNVKALVLRCPVVAADALHDRDPGGLGALINSAYGSSGNWEADKANRDPSDSSHTTQIAAIKDKVRIWYSTDDPTVLPSDITSYVAATGVKAIPFGAVGHNPFGSHVHAAAQAQWIWSRLNS